MKRKKKKKDDLHPALSQKWKFPIRSSKDRNLYMKYFKTNFHFWNLFLNMYIYINVYVYPCIRRHTNKHTALHKNNNAKMLIFYEIQEMNGQPSNTCMQRLSFALIFHFFPQDS